MDRKRYKKLKELLADTVHDIAHNPYKWRTFLEVSTRFFKYRFEEQLLIYAQAPDATAMATYDIWNSRMFRPVRRGQSGIGIIRKVDGKDELRYVFDISQTRELPYSRAPYILQVEPADYQDIVEYMRNTWYLGENVPENLSLEQTLFRYVRFEVEDRIDYEFEELTKNLGDSVLAEFAPEDLKEEYRALVTDSCYYAMLYRCGLDTSEISPDAMHQIRFFSSENLMECVGNLCVDIYGEGLKGIGAFLRKRNKEKTLENENETSYNKFNELTRHIVSAEGGKEHDATGNQRADAQGTSPVFSGARTEGDSAENRIYPMRGLFYPELSNGGSGRRDWEVRKTPEKISGGELSGEVFRDADEGRTEPTSGGYRETMSGADGSFDGFDAQETPGTGQGNRQSGMGSTHEESPLSGGAYRQGGNYFQLSLFPTEKEQEEQCRIAASTSSEVTAAIFISDKDVDEISDRVWNEYEKREQALTEVSAVNFHITDDQLGNGSPKEKFRANIRAIQTLKKCESENRYATAEEQENMSRYVGWGGLAKVFEKDAAGWEKEYDQLLELLTPDEYASARSSVNNAHFTQPVIVEAMYDALYSFGFRKGNLLEPALGIGNFFGSMPEELRDSRLYGVELDSISGRIARKLYPDAHIEIKGYEETAFPNDFFDVAVGNVPFGNYQVYDRNYSKYHFMIHDYFLAKTIDQLRPGGIAAFITSKGTMDKSNRSLREYVAGKANLLGAVRLPNTAFKGNAGTEVTSDILFFQKRGNARIQMPDWVETGVEEHGFTVNRYYIEHPDMILGTLKEVSGPFGNEVTCVKNSSSSLKYQLETALKKLNAVYKPAQPDMPTDELEGAVDSLPATPDVENYSYTLVDGKLYFREDSLLVAKSVPKASEERIVGMIEIRDAVRRLIALQMDAGTTETEIQDAQQELNEMYDTFAERYGRIESTANKRAFSEDASYYLLTSLEITDENGDFIKKADIFSKRTIRRAEPVTSVETCVEALALSMNRYARVDLEYMAQISGKNPEQVTEELKGIIFQNPLTQQWENADEYLSGNIRQKLQAAKTFAEQNPKYQVNVAALEKVLPKPLTASEIEVRIGATWIDKRYYEEFMKEVLHTPWYLLSKHIAVEYSGVTGNWHVKGKNADYESNTLVYQTYGTARANAYDILEDSLNLRDVQIYDKIEIDGKEKRILNKKETILAG